MRCGEEPARSRSVACSGLREGLRKFTKEGSWPLETENLRHLRQPSVVQGQRVLRADKPGVDPSSVDLALGSWESRLCSLSLWPQFPQQEL